MTTKIFLVDDHKIMRDGLRALLEKQRGFQVVGEAKNGRTAMEKIGELKPDVIIMDIAMPNMNGMEATRQILAKTPDVKVLALSMHSDKRFVAGMLKAGAKGYLLKDCAFEEVTEAVRAVVANQIYISPGITQVVMEDYMRFLTQDAPFVDSPITAREREVLQLLTEGNSAKEIASRLHISVKTIETHRQHIVEKLNIHSVAELTKYAIRTGLTSL